MADFILQAKDYQASPNFQDLRSTPGGGMVVGDWLHSYITRGYGWHVTIGALSTGVVGGGAGTILDQDQPEGIISVPLGYTLVPFRIGVQVDVGIQTTDSHVNEILIAADRAAAWAGDGTVTAETPFNLRSDLTAGCPASCASAATGNITNPTLGMELARKEALTDVQGTAATVLVTTFDLLYDPKYPPFLVGPAALYLYWGGSIAATGYAQCQFLVLPSSLVTTQV